MTLQCYLNKFLYTEEIDRIIKTDKQLTRYYVGTYAADIKPKNIGKNCCWIWNTDEHYKSGQHWVALWKKGNKVYFFDSYGKNPSFYNNDYWYKYIRDMNCTLIVDSTKQYQSHISTTCGLWSIYFLYRKTRNKNMGFHSSNLIRNEKTLRERILDLFPVVNRIYRKKCRKGKDSQKCCKPLLFK